MELYARNITRDENQYHSLFTISMPVAFNVDILWDSPLLEITIKKKKSVSDFPPRQSVKSWALFHSELRKNAEGSGNKGSMFFCASYILLRQYDTMTQVGSVQVRIRVFCGPLCKHWHTLLAHAPRPTAPAYCNCNVKSSGAIFPGSHLCSLWA